MSLEFEKYASKGHEFVKLVEEELNIQADSAGRIIRSVFHALRNRLSHEESFHLLAQLPMVLKGVYVDGWKFEKDFKRIHTVNDFLDEMRDEDGNTAEYDFGNNQRATAAAIAVFKAMHYFVSEGELNDIVAELPEPLKNLVNESLNGNMVVL